MSESSDPPRLAQDPNAGPLGKWLRDGQGELPSQQQMARLSARLEPAFAAPEVSAGPADRAPLSKLLLGALGVVGVGALVFALRSGHDAQRAAPQPPPHSTPSAVIPKTSAAPSPAAVELAPAPAAALNSAVPPKAAAATSASPSNAARNTRAPALSEAALLEQARSALASDPARALALTQQHQTRFPSGVLKQEREVIAIEALRRLGRSQAATERAGSFEQAFPDSAHRRAVESGLSK